ncbi:MAG TPA: glycosyltransferase [Trebonia sp.]|jgi:glycosyltransferase involved in cell wall biosynthesis|nr:glycosyltransferase [Trebonia sp.]
MEKPLKCSVIIPTYNRAVLLGHTLESLARQSLPPGQFEVIVVDDGSRDATADVVESFGQRLNLHYFFQEDEGYRVAKARNVGIANAAADVCVLIDSGVVLHSGCLAAHIASHDAGQGPVAVLGYIRGFSMNGEDRALAGAIDLDDLDGTIGRMEAAKRWRDVREVFYAKYTDDFHALPAPWVIFWTGNVSASTELARSIGGFDEAFQSWAGEDIDFGYRLFNAGAKIVLNRQASSIHLPHPKQFADNNGPLMANHRYMAAKYGTPIIELLTEWPETLEELTVDSVTPFSMNDVIRERGLPSCSEYLRRQGVTPGN